MSREDVKRRLHHTQHSPQEAAHQESCLTISTNRYNAICVFSGGDDDDGEDDDDDDDVDDDDDGGGGGGVDHEEEDVDY
ncbi:hypothetical protein ElyMa_003556600, partial [Elysia marginata]